MRRLSLLFLGLACLVWLAGCGSTDNLMVAKVDGKSITGRDFKAAAAKLHSTKATKDKVLQILIDKELLVLEAHNRGLDTSKAVVTELEREKQAQMVKLLEEKLGQGIQVTEPEIEQYYKQHGLDKREEVRVRHILVKTRQEAEEILKQLKQGADFAKLAKEKSIDKATAAKGGDLGYWEEGAVIGPTAQKIFSLKVGEISEPFQSGAGFHIFQVVERRPVGLEKQRKAIVRRIKWTKLMEKFSNYMKRLWEEMGININQQVLTLLVKRASQEAVPSFTPEERQKILIGYAGKGVTLGEYLHWVENLSRPYRPNLADSLQVVRSVQRFARYSLLLPEALRRQKIKFSEQLQAQFKKRKEELMVTELRRLETEAKLITPQAIREYYHTYPDLFVKPPKVTVEIVLFNNLKDAKRALRQIRAGVPMQKIAQKFPPVSKRFQNYRKFSFYVTERNRKILGVTAEMATKAKPGEIKGPYSLSLGRGEKRTRAYAILQVLDKQPAGHYSLSNPNVQRDIARMIKREKEAELNKAFQQLVAKVRAKYSQQVVVYEKALKKLPEPAEICKKGA